MPISGSFAKFLHILTNSLNQRIPSSVSAFNISDLISFSPAAFPDFIPLIAVTISAAVKNYFSPKCVTSCVSRVDALTEFKRSAKYSLHCERISFSSVRMLPAECLLEYVTLDLLPRKRRMIRKNTLFAEKQLESNQRPNSSQDFSLDLFIAEVAAFHASVFQDCKSDDDLTCNQALNASFCARIGFEEFFFNLLVPSRCSFLTFASHSKPFSPTSFSS